MNNPPNLFT